MKKLRLLGAVCALTAGLVASTVVNAAVIHESATLGTTGISGGTFLNSDQFLGSRFSITSSVSVDNVGGHLSGSGTLFAAIVSLSSSNALPTGSPFDPSEVVASTFFTAPSLSDDILIPLNVTLAPGDYGLILGSGLFGATGTGAMPLNDFDIPGSASYFSSYFTVWGSGGFNNARFVVTGTVVPIPPALWLFGSGLLGLLGAARRKKAA